MFNHVINDVDVHFNISILLEVSQSHFSKDSSSSGADFKKDIRNNRENDKQIKDCSFVLFSCVNKSFNNCNNSSPEQHGVYGEGEVEDRAVVEGSLSISEYQD